LPHCRFENKSRSASRSVTSSNLLLRGDSQAFADGDYYATNGNQNPKKGKRRTKVTGQQTQAAADDYELKNQQEEYLVTTPIQVMGGFVDEADDDRRNK
jgi:hypothetical protein